MRAHISVIVPVYNGAAFIADTIQSALDQTCLNVEIIVVDDGSTDDTAARLARFGDTIRVIRIPNGGVSHARNVGIAASRGELLAFLDADDLWQPDKLARQLSMMETFPEVGFCCCNYTVRERAGAPPLRHFDRFARQADLPLDRPLPAPAALAPLIRANFVGTSSNVMLRRSVLAHAGLFDTRLRQAEDYDLWLRCASHTGFLLMSAVLLDKRSHATNLTNDYVETLQCHERVLMMLLESPAAYANGNLAPQICKALAETRYQVGNLLFNRGDIAACFRQFAAGLKAQRSPANTWRFGRHAARKLLRLGLGSVIGKIIGLGDRRRPSR